MGITEKLERWYQRNKRDLPWRRTASPYHIWLSEIILQQTRVNQGLDYYLRFVGRYPAVHDLAAAPLDEVLKLWQGLGYYTRARNLHITARQIVREYNGEFPGQYHDLLRLKGIGAYTAAAVASIAFNQPVALVDGNVYRVLSRFFGIDIPVDSASGKHAFQEKANAILNREKPGIHNQALMEFGALVCVAKNPNCRSCVLASDCLAFREGKTGLLPVKAGKIKPRMRYYNYLFIRYKGFTYLHQRNGKDIWNSLFEFPLIESGSPVSLQILKGLPEWQALFGNRPVEVSPFRKTYRHQLTHQVLFCSFYHVAIDFRPEAPGFNPIEIPVERVFEYAVPRVIDKYMSDLQQEALL